MSPRSLPVRGASITGTPEENDRFMHSGEKDYLIRLAALAFAGRLYRTSAFAQDRGVSDTDTVWQPNRLWRAAC
jgi:hypothetical protein